MVIYGAVVFIILTIFVGIGVYWWQFQGHKVSVDNAVISGDFVKVKSKVPGFLAEVNVSDGEMVKAGQVLGKVRVKILPEHLEELKRSLDTAKGNYQEILTRPVEDTAKPQQVSGGDKGSVDQAWQQKEKMESLLAIGGISSMKYQESVMAYQQAKEQYEASAMDVASLKGGGISAESNQQLLKLAEQRIVQAERDLKRAAEEVQVIEIKSNFDGMVYVHNINLEEELTAGQELFAIGNLRDLWVEFSVAEQLGAKITLGMMVNYTIDEYIGRSFSGTVCEIIDKSKNPDDPSARGYRIRVSVQSDDSIDIKPGMKVSAKLSV